MCFKWVMNEWLIARATCFSADFVKSEAKAVKTVPSSLPRQSLLSYYWRPCQRDSSSYLAIVCIHMSAI